MPDRPGRGRRDAHRGGAPLRRPAPDDSTGRGSWSSTTCTGSIRRASGMVELLVERDDRAHPLVVLAGIAARPAAGVGRSAGRRAARPARPARARDRPLATLVARAAVDADGARSIHERTGGNPLFVGETVRALLEDGTLEWRDGRVALIETRRAAAAGHAAGRARRPHRRPRPGGARGRSASPRSSASASIGDGIERAARRRPCRRRPSRPPRRRGADPSGRGRRVAVRPRAHPRRGLCRPAGEPPAGPPRAAGRPPRGAAPARRHVGQIAVHRAAAGDAERALPAPARGGRCRRWRSGRRPRRPRSGGRPPTSRRRATRRPRDRRPRRGRATRPCGGRRLGPPRRTARRGATSGRRRDRRARRLGEASARPRDGSGAGPTVIVSPSTATCAQRPAAAAQGLELGAAGRARSGRAAPIAPRRARASSMRLLGGQMAALEVVVATVAQGGFDQQQIGAAHASATASDGPVSPV